MTWRLDVPNIRGQQICPEVQVTRSIPFKLVMYQVHQLMSQLMYGMLYQIKRCARNSTEASESISRSK